MKSSRPEDGFTDDPFDLLELERLVHKLSVDNLDQSPELRRLMTRVNDMKSIQSRLVSEQFKSVDPAVVMAVDKILAPLFQAQLDKLNSVAVKLIRTEMSSLKTELNKLKTSMIMGAINPFLWLEAEIVRQSLFIIKSSPEHGSSVQNLVQALEKLGVQLPGTNSMDRYTSVVMLLRRCPELKELEGFYFQLVHDEF